MKKTTFWLMAFCLILFGWQAKSQTSCETAVALSDGYSQTGITTDGSQGWISAPGDTCGVSWRLWGADDYVFTYTAETAESLQLNMLVNSTGIVSGMFTSCDGTTISGCLGATYAQTDGTIVLEANVNAGQTVYVLVSEITGATGGLNFDVTSFNATEIACPIPVDLAVSDITTKEATLSWTAGSDETSWMYAILEGGSEIPTEATGEITENTISLTELTPDTAYDFYVKANCGEADGESEWAGPVSFSTLIACHVPTALQVADVTKTTATMSWTAGGDETEWYYVVQESGPGQPIMASIKAETPSVALTDLSASTMYEFYVKANCGEEDGESEWVGPYYFATECDVFTEFYEDFESTTGRDFPVCWQKVGEAGDAYPQTSPVLEGSRNLYMKSSSETDRAVVTLPTVSNANAGTHQLKMKVKATVASQVGQTLELGYLTDLSDVETFVVISSITTTNLAIQEFVTVPNNLPEGDITFALRTGVDSKNIVVDAVAWEAKAACPMVTNVTTTEITGDSITINWVDNGTATAWEVAYGDSGFSIDEANVMTAEALPFTVGELNAASTYDIYIRSSCGDSQASAWFGPYTVKTICPVYDIYIEDFSTANHQDYVGVPELCWTEGNNTDIAEGPNGANGNWRASGFLGSGFTGSMSFNFFNDATEKDWLVSPALDFSQESMGVTLGLGMAQSGSGVNGDEATMQDGDEIQLLISEDDGETWTNVYTWTSENQPTNEKSTLTIDLSAYTSARTRLAFWGNNGTVTPKNYTFYIDDIAIDAYATLSVNEAVVLDDESFSFYPNPVQHILTLQAKYDIETVVVYNMLGQEVTSVAPNQKKSQLDMSHLPVGAYFVKVSAQGVVKTVRIIKK